MMRFSAGLKLALGLAVLLTGSVLRADDAESQPNSGFVEGQKLRMEARVAAESGDFLGAVEKIRDAAVMVHDRVTAQQADKMRQKLEAAGGNQFADFSSLITLIQDQTSPPAQWFDIDQVGGRISIFAQGVYLGAPSVLGSVAASLDNSSLHRAAELARTANQNADVRAASELRLVSVTRLEQEVQRLVDAGQTVPEDMANLAGLSRIDYLFVFPETGDIVLGGPASGWTYDVDGRAIAESTNRPTLQMDDLIVLTRAFTSGGSGYFMCTIDPRQQQVAALQEYVQANGNQLSRRNARRWTEKLEDVLGLQDVHVQGIPADSRIASVIVEADYRMKQIGIGKRRGVDGMKSYFGLLRSSDRSGGLQMSALRWWLTAGQGAIEAAVNGEAFSFSGQSVRCLSENQILAENGQRVPTGTADGANAEFARLFTKHLPELAAEDAVFADLENIFSLALASAIVHGHGVADRAGWVPGEFSAKGATATQSVPVPDQLMTAANCRVYSNGEVVIQVAGGVQANLMEVIRDADAFRNSEELAEPAEDASPVGHANRWWWDAAAR